MNSWGDALGELLRRPGRSLLSLLSVVIAVAAIVAVTSATATTRVAYRTVLQTLSGRADLEVVPHSKGLFKQDIIKEIRSVPGIRAAVPILLQGTNLSTEDAKVKVLISGIILDEPESVAGYKITDGRLPEAANEIALEKQLAEELKLAVGGEVKLFTRDLRKPYKISGLVAPENAARLHQGGMILAPLDALQRAFHLKGKVSAIHLFLDDPKQSSEIIARVSPLLPEQVVVRIPALRNGIAEETLLLTEVSLNMASTLSFTTAVFIVLTVFLMNVSERRRHLSIMRAIGATRRQIMGLVCREAFLMGVVGTIFGIPLGIYGGGFLIHTMAAMLGVTLPTTPDLRWAFAVGALVGPAVCLVAAWYPARKASRVSPLEGMRPTVTVEPQRGHFVTTTVGVIGSLITVLLSIGTARGTIPMWSAVFGVVLALVSLILLLPIALLPSVRVLSWPIRQVLGLEGEMSERLVLRHAGRSALTIGVLFIAVAAGVGTSNAVFSVTDDIRTWYQRTITADFLLRAMMPDLSGQAPPSMPDSMRDEIAALPEVDKVDAVRFLQIDANGLDAKMVTREFRIYDQVPLNLVTGDPNGMLDRLRAGNVVVGTVLAERAGLHVGDSIKVTQGTKTESFQITGIVSEYTFGGLVVTIDRDVATRLFEIDGVDSFLIQSKPGQSAQLEPKLKAIADQQGLLLSSFGEVLKFVDSTIAGTTGGLWILLALGLLVGALGVINTLTMNVLEETRELGVLRAIGMRRGQIIKTVLGQASIIGLLGIIAGGCTGLCLARMINVSLGSLFGRYISFALRPQFMGLLLLASLAVVLLAALYPARRAAAFSPMEAMRQD